MRRIEAQKEKPHPPRPATQAISAAPATNPPWRQHPGGTDRLTTAQLAGTQLIAWGVLYYTFSIYLPAMEEELGWSTEVLAGGFSLGLLLAGLCAPVVGAVIDRRGTRAVMTVGATIGTCGVLLWSASNSLGTYFAAWTLIGVAMASTLYEPAFATVVQAQKPDGGPSTALKTRRHILVISLVGGLASTIFLPLASVLAEVFGWRVALALLAGVLGVTTIPLNFFLPNSPVRGRDGAADDSTAIPQPRLRRPVPGFAWLSLSLMLANFVSVALHAHLITFLLLQGLSPLSAAGIAGVAGLAKLGGRLLSGWNTNWSAATLLFISLAVQGAGLTLPLLWPTQMWATTAMVLLFGATSGARTVLRPAIVIDLLGQRRFARANGVLQAFTSLSKAAGPIVFGAITTAYGVPLAWTTLVLLMAASAICCATLATMSRSREP